MPRFFFDMNDGVETRDEIGEELPDVALAVNEARRVALAYADAPSPADTGNGAIEVRARDETGVIVATVRLVLSVEAH